MPRETWQVPPQGADQLKSSRITTLALRFALQVDERAAVPITIRQSLAKELICPFVFIASTLNGEAPP